MGSDPLRLAAWVALSVGSYALIRWVLAVTAPAHLSARYQAVIAALATVLVVSAIAGWLQSRRPPEDR